MRTVDFKAEDGNGRYRENKLLMISKGRDLMGSGTASAESTKLHAF